MFFHNGVHVSVSVNEETLADVFHANKVLVSVDKFVKALVNNLIEVLFEKPCHVWIGLLEA